MVFVAHLLCCVAALPLADAAELLFVDAIRFEGAAALSLLQTRANATRKEALSLLGESATSGSGAKALRRVRTQATNKLAFALKENEQIAANNKKLEEEVANLRQVAAAASRRNEDLLQEGKAILKGICHDPALLRPEDEEKEATDSVPDEAAEVAQAQATPAVTENKDEEAELSDDAVDEALRVATATTADETAAEDTEPIALFQMNSTPRVNGTPIGVQEFNPFSFLQMNSTSNSTGRSTYNGGQGNTERYMRDLRRLEKAGRKVGKLRRKLKAKHRKLQKTKASLLQQRQWQEASLKSLDARSQEMRDFGVRLRTNLEESRTEDLDSVKMAGLEKLGLAEQTWREIVALKEHVHELSRKAGIKATSTEEPDKPQLRTPIALVSLQALAKGEHNEIAQQSKHAADEEHRNEMRILSTMEHTIGKECAETLRSIIGRYFHGAASRNTTRTFAQKAEQALTAMQLAKDKLLKDEEVLKHLVENADLGQMNSNVTNEIKAIKDTNAGLWKEVNAASKKLIGGRKRGKLSRLATRAQELEARIAPIRQRIQKLFRVGEHEAGNKRAKLLIEEHEALVATREAFLKMQVNLKSALDKAAERAAGYDSDEQEKPPASEEGEKKSDSMEEDDYLWNPQAEQVWQAINTNTDHDTEKVTTDETEYEAAAEEGTQEAKSEPEADMDSGSEESKLFAKKAVAAMWKTAGSTAELGEQDFPSPSASSQGESVSEDDTVAMDDLWNQAKENAKAKLGERTPAASDTADETTAADTTDEVSSVSGTMAKAMDDLWHQAKENAKAKLGERTPAASDNADETAAADTTDEVSSVADSTAKEEAPQEAMDLDAVWKAAQEKAKVRIKERVGHASPEPDAEEPEQASMEEVERPAVKLFEKSESDSVEASAGAARRDGELQHDQHEADAQEGKQDAEEPRRHKKKGSKKKRKGAAEEPQQFAKKAVAAMWEKAGSIAKLAQSKISSTLHLTQTEAGTEDEAVESVWERAKQMAKARLASRSSHKSHTRSKTTAEAPVAQEGMSMDAEWKEAEEKAKAQFEPTKKDAVATSGEEEAEHKTEQEEVQLPSTSKSDIPEASAMAAHSGGELLNDADEEFERQRQEKRKQKRGRIAPASMLLVSKPHVVPSKDVRHPDDAAVEAAEAPKPQPGVESFSDDFEQLKAMVEKFAPKATRDDWDKEEETEENTNFSLPINLDKDAAYARHPWLRMLSLVALLVVLVWALWEFGMPSGSDNAEATGSSSKTFAAGKAAVSAIAKAAQGKRSAIIRLPANRTKFYSSSHPTTPRSEDGFSFSTAAVAKRHRSNMRNNASLSLSAACKAAAETPCMSAEAKAAAAAEPFAAAPKAASSKAPPQLPRLKLPVPGDHEQTASAASMKVHDGASPSSRMSSAPSSAKTQNLAAAAAAALNMAPPPSADELSSSGCEQPIRMDAEDSPGASPCASWRSSAPSVSDFQSASMSGSDTVAERSQPAHDGDDEEAAGMSDSDESVASENSLMASYEALDMMNLARAEHQRQAEGQQSRR